MKQKTATTTEPILHVKKSRTGLGLFAGSPLKKGQFVIEYTGELISDDEANRRGGKYLFTISKKWTIDGKDRKNIARYINHSCRPNCESDVRERKLKVEIRTKRAIKPGEELTYDYGKEYFDEFIKPHGCKCDKCLAKQKTSES